MADERRIGILAFLAAAPALAIPFIADDWVNLAAVAERIPLRTPFSYFRPLYLGSFWAERRVWGLNSVAFHLTNVALIALCAALVVVVLRRLTDDPRWATAAGALFALHPYHVENAGWIAARADVGATLLVLSAWLAYERWESSGRGIPWIALIAFEAALLFKESVVLFPVMVALLVALRRGPSRREALAGILPLGAVAALHFLVLRRAADQGIPADQKLLQIASQQQHFSDPPDWPKRCREEQHVAHQRSAILHRCEVVVVLEPPKGTRYHHILKVVRPFVFGDERLVPQLDSEVPSFPCDRLT